MNKVSFKSVIFLCASLLLGYILTFRGMPLFLDSKILLMVTQNIVNNHSMSLPKHSVLMKNPNFQSENIQKKHRKNHNQKGKKGKKLKGKKQSFMKYTSKNGKVYSHYGPGQPILAAPLYYTGIKLKKKLSPDTNKLILNNPPLFLTMFFNIIITILICLTFYYIILIEFSVSEKRAVWFTIILGLGTNVFSMTRTFFQHPLSTLLMLFSFAFLLQFRQKNRKIHLLLSGFFLAYGIISRITILIPVLIFGLFLTFDLILSVKRKKITFNDLVISLFAFALPILLGIIVQLMINWIIFGKFLLSGYNAGSISLFSFSFKTAIRGFIYSPGRSFFIYSAPLLLIFIAFWKFLKTDRFAALLILTLSGSIFALYSSFWIWFGGDCFGPRYLNSLIPFLMIPIAKYYDNVSNKKLILQTLPLFLFGVILQFAGSITSFYNRPAKVTNQKYLFDFSASQLSGIIKNINHHSFDSWFYNIWKINNGKIVIFSSIIFLLAMIIIFFPKTNNSVEISKR